MTNLSKPLTRRVDADSGRVQIAITINPAGTLTFREKVSRRSYTTTIMACYKLAVMADNKKGG
jgi:hypothetical protein